jgi:bacillithiol system protein YtxJ
MNWGNLTDNSQLDQISSESQHYPILIFKHSTSCSISSMAKLRLESSWNLDQVKTYFLDLLSFRSLSNAIAEKFDVHHESPQVILIYKGECIYDASHFDISLVEIRETLDYHKIPFKTIV